MKVFDFLLLVSIAAAAAAAGPQYFNIDAGSFVAQMQIDVLHLLSHITDPLNAKFTNLKDASEHFQPTADNSIYKDEGHAVKSLVKDIDDSKVLKRHHYFCLFNAEHRHNAIQLFEVFLSCKDWNCVVNNAAYFRDRINEGAFIYGLYVAVIHMPMTSDIALPPLYEITPHMFTSAKVINQAYSAKMTQKPGNFHVAFSGNAQKNKEHRVTYFVEDIGLMSHHLIWHMEFPFWWKDSYGYHLDRKGELFLWVHHQLMARLDAERLSNHLDHVTEISWEKPLAEGFAPHTTYKYGGNFPARPDNIHFQDVDGVARIRDMIIMELRIRDAIAHGYVEDSEGHKIDIRNENGIDVLGNIIEASTYSVNSAYYGSLHTVAHIFLGRQRDPHGKYNLPPTVMEHFETVTRDPVFFKLHKYMDNIITEHKNALPQYTREDLEFSGVTVDDVHIEGKLETYFEDYDFNLANAVDHSEKVDDVAISAIVSRLNHEPFDFEIDVTNNNSEDVFATVRIYLCPRRDGDGVVFKFNEGKWHCIEIDKFWKTLQSGSNHIVRHSVDVSTTAPDALSLESLYIKAEAALKSGTELDLHDYVRGCGFPNRILLPKGKELGMEFNLITMLTNDGADHSLEKNEHNTHSLCGIHGEKYPDPRPLGYPLDRKVSHEDTFFNFSNFNKRIVTITHNAHH